MMENSSVCLEDRSPFLERSYDVHILPYLTLLQQA